MLGLRLGTRMTVVRLTNGGLLLHSPVLMSPALREELDAIGPVSHIVCPDMLSKFLPPEFRDKPLLDPLTFSAVLNAEVREAAIFEGGDWTLPALEC